MEIQTNGRQSSKSRPLHKVRRQRHSFINEISAGFFTSFSSGCFSFVCLLAFVPGLSETCRLEACLNEHPSFSEQRGLKDPESTAAYCQQLRAYGACLKATSRSCRGDLQFHSTWSIITTLTKRFNCSRFRLKSQRQECYYNGKQQYSTCSLYGPTHLVTFSTLHRSCKFQEASLIDNQFFKITATSENDASLSKIMVQIKSEGTPCAADKQYVAYSDRELAPVFVDQTHTGGLNNSIRVNSSRDDLTQYLQIYLRYIDTAIEITKWGGHLGFSCRIPSDILSFDPGGPEICRNGCASDIPDSRTSTDQDVWRAAVEKCSESPHTNCLDGTSWGKQRSRCLFHAISSFYQNSLDSSSISPLPTSSVPNSTLSDGGRNDIDLTSKGLLLPASVLPVLSGLSFFIFIWYN